MIGAAPVEVAAPPPPNPAALKLTAHRAQVRDVLLLDELNRRGDLYAAAETDRTLQAELLSAYYWDGWTWFRDWVWIANRRFRENRLPPRLPVIASTHQEEVWRWRDYLFDESRWGVLEKSRFVLASYIAVGWHVHRFLFWDGYSGGLASYRAKEIDKRGNMDSLLEKARFILKNLPPWMVEALTGADVEIEGKKKRVRWTVFGPYDNHMLLQNPRTGSQITGDVVKNLAVGGRRAFQDVDEAARCPGLEGVLSDLSESSPAAMFFSTAKGVGNQFYRMVVDPKYPKKRLHWTDNPLNDPDYGDRFERKHGSHTRAQELEMDYTGSIAGVAIPPEWVASAIDFEIPEPEGGWIRKSAGMDVAEAGSADSVIFARNGPQVIDAEAWNGANTNESAFRGARFAHRNGAEVFRYDSIGVGAGVTGTLQGAQHEAAKEERWKFTLQPIAWGRSPTSAFYDDEPESPADQRFRIDKDEQWWALRERFRKTHETRLALAGEPECRVWPLDECISIPRAVLDKVPQLISQLSTPTWKTTGTGKTTLETKKELAARGIPSPDYADALVMTFADMLGLVGRVVSGELSDEEVALAEEEMKLEAELIARLEAGEEIDWDDVDL